MKNRLEKWFTNNYEFFFYLESSLAGDTGKRKSGTFLQKQLPPKIPFPCRKYRQRSAIVPDNVHQLRPGTRKNTRNKCGDVILVDLSFIFYKKKVTLMLLLPWEMVWPLPLVQMRLILWKLPWKIADYHSALEVKYSRVQIEWTF